MLGLKFWRNLIGKGRTIIEHLDVRILESVIFSILNTLQLHEYSMMAKDRTSKTIKV